MSLLFLFHNELNELNDIILNHNVKSDIPLMV